eukprot:jgi/Mesvir1/25728/Mv01912-RA.1
MAETVNVPMLRIVYTKYCARDRTLLAMQPNCTNVQLEFREVRGKTTGPCAYVCRDILFKSATKVDYIRFQNHYCSSITVKVKTSAILPGASSPSPDRWHTVVQRYPLMAHPHFEDDAQAVHLLGPHVLHLDPISAVALTRALAMRIYLFQVSPMWPDYAIKGIECLSSQQS